MIDIVAPVIVAPPRTGKTVLMQNIAHSITAFALLGVDVAGG